jgi:hypothetical protein
MLALRKSFSLIIIIAAATFFAFFTIIDDMFVLDVGLKQIYEDVAIAITLAIIGVTSSKYFSDETTHSVLQEVKKMNADFKQRLENLESQFKLDKTKM